MATTSGVTTICDVKMFEKSARRHLKALSATHGVKGTLLIWKPGENTDRLRKKYWCAMAIANHLHHVINERERVKQESCSHDWEYENSRDERTRYTCKKCGLFR